MAQQPVAIFIDLDQFSSDGIKAHSILMQQGRRKGFGMMQDFVRIGSYIWPYRRLFMLSVVCAVIVSAFWALNLSIAFPVVKVLFQNDSLHAYVDSEIESLEKTIREGTVSLETIPEDQFKPRAKIQARVSEQ